MNVTTRYHKTQGPRTRMEEWDSCKEFYQAFDPYMEGLMTNLQGIPIDPSKPALISYRIPI
jgi:hypothetical protein